MDFNHFADPGIWVITQMLPTLLIHVRTLPCPWVIPEAFKRDSQKVQQRNQGREPERDSRAEMDGKTGMERRDGGGITPPFTTHKFASGRRRDVR